MADDPVVVIRCMDPRFQNEWVELMNTTFGSHYAIALVGGAYSIFSPYGKSFLGGQLREIERIFPKDGFSRLHFALVSHYKCKAYSESKEYLAELQGKHLRDAASLLMKIIMDRQLGTARLPRVSLHSIWFAGEAPFIMKVSPG